VGSYAIVRRAHNLCAKANGYPDEVAIKTIDVAKVTMHAQLPTVEAEVALLRSLHHPYIAKLYETISDPISGTRSVILTSSACTCSFTAWRRSFTAWRRSFTAWRRSFTAWRRSFTGTISLVLEYAAGGELYSLIERGGAIAEDEAALILAELLDVVGYLHARSIVHNDIKPENVCFVNEAGSIRLIDFGYAAIVRPNVLRGSSWCGTPKYVSPEQLSGRGFESTTPGAHD
jgi:serine/threonine protein kinase